MCLLFISPLWVITCINLLPDNLRLRFLYFFLFFFCPKITYFKFQEVVPTSCILFCFNSVQGELSIVLPGLWF